LIQDISNLINKIQQYGSERIFNRYYSTYLAEVTDVEDPKEMERIRVKVFAVNKDEELAKWAIYQTPWAGNNFGAKFPVRVGDFVWVKFEYGDIRYPIWSSMNYAENEVPDSLRGKNKMGFASREGHYDVLSEDDEEWIRKMVSGSRILMRKKDIKIEAIEDMLIKAGRNVTKKIGGDSTVNIKGKLNTTIDGAAGITYKDVLNILVEADLNAAISGNTTIDATKTSMIVSDILNLGADNATFSAVHGEVLETYLQTLSLILIAHQHISPWLGAPTSPMIPSPPQPPDFKSDKVKLV